MRSVQSSHLFVYVPQWGAQKMALCKCIVTSVTVPPSRRVRRGSDIELALFEILCSIGRAFDLVSGSN